MAGAGLAWRLFCGWGGGDAGRHRFTDERRIGRARFLGMGCERPKESPRQIQRSIGDNL